MTPAEDVDVAIKDAEAEQQGGPGSNGASSLVMGADGKMYNAQVLLLLLLLLGCPALPALAPRCPA